MFRLLRRKIHRIAALFCRDSEINQCKTVKEFGCEHIEMFYFQRLICIAVYDTAFNVVFELFNTIDKQKIHSSDFE